MQMITKTLVPPALQGVIFVTGFFGIGKTSLLAQLDRPENVVFFDFDAGKSENLHSQLKFGAYFNVQAEVVKFAGKANYTDQDVFNWFAKTLTELPKDMFATAIIDNVTPLEQAFIAEIKRSPITYNTNPANVQAGRYGGANAGVPYLISRVIAALQGKGVKTIGVTAHVGAVWQNGVQVPNRFNAKGSSDWQRVSLLTLALIPSGNMAPAGIVIKESFGQVSLNDEGDFVVKRILPTRIPVATVKAIKGYLNEPVADRPLREGETATDEDMSMWISNKFTKSQIEFMREAMENLRLGLTGEGEEGVAAPTTTKKTSAVKLNDWAALYAKAGDKSAAAKKMAAEKVPFKDIAAKLGIAIEE